MQREKVLLSIPSKFTKDMNHSLATSISLAKLHKVAKAMAKDKDPRPNGIVVEFFV
jgi:hypothetical protein